MRELFVVAVSADGRRLHLAGTADATRPSHSIAVDERLSAALRGDLGPPGEPDARPQIALSVKEIQARLRAGETPEQVARAAGVSLARIERFSGPVISEREAVLDEVWAVHLERQRRGPSVLPLRAAVEASLASMASLKPGSVEWTARRVAPGAWVVEVRYQLRGRVRVAGWSWDSSQHLLAAVDAGSATLGHSDGTEEPAEPARASRTSVRAVPQLPEGGRPRGSQPAPPRRRTAGAKAAPRKTATSPAKAAAPAKAARGTAAPARKSVLPPAPATTSPTRKAAPAKAAARKAAPAKAATAKAATAKATPAKAALAKAATAKAAPAKAAPAKAAPAKAAARKATPAKATPAKEVARKAAPRTTPSTPASTVGTRKAVPGAAATPPARRPRRPLAEAPLAKAAIRATPTRATPARATPARATPARATPAPEPVDPAAGSARARIPDWDEVVRSTRRTGPGGREVFVRDDAPGGSGSE